VSFVGGVSDSTRVSSTAENQSMLKTVRIGITWSKKH